MCHDVNVFFWFDKYLNMSWSCILFCEVQCHKLFFLFLFSSKPCCDSAGSRGKFLVTCYRQSSNSCPLG